MTQKQRIMELETQMEVANSKWKQFRILWQAGRQEAQRLKEIIRTGDFYHRRIFIKGMKPQCKFAGLDAEGRF